MISPEGATSMFKALGLDGKPGSVATVPAKGNKNPAPTDALMSLIGNV
jgi:hypothetical protein